MNRIQRYLFRHLLVATLYATAGLTLTIWLSQSLRLIEIVVESGAPLGIFLWLLLLTVPTFLGIVLPLALVGAILFTYNRLAVDSELVVMRAAGFSSFALARPAIVLALLVTSVVYALNLWITPAAHRELVGMEYAVRNDYSQLLLREGVFNDVSEKFSVFLRQRDSDANLHDVLIHDGRDPVKPVTIMGKRAVMLTGPEGARFVVYDGNRQELDRTTGQLSQLYFERYAVDLKVLSADAAERWPDARERTTAELLDPPPELLEVPKMAQELRAEIHHRFASPLMGIAFAMLALATLLSGEFNRRGQASRITIAIVLVVLLQAAVLGLTSLAGKRPVYVPLMYVLPLVVMVPGIITLGRGLKRGRMVVPSHSPGQMAGQE